jgi:predicted MPP superfamily phosphohydrolase
MRPLSYVAGFYLCMFFYLAGIFFFWDLSRLTRWAVRKARERRHGAREAGQQSGDAGSGSGRRGSPFDIYSPRTTLVAVLVCTAMTACAFYAPTHIKTTHYDVEIDRRGSDLDHLKAVMISDSHIGPAVREKQIDEIVRLTMNENPDVILFAGDIFDEGTQESLRIYASNRFAELKAKYGVYFVLGNHDDYLGDTDEVLGYMRSAGMTCLLDDVELTDGSFYVAGRRDRSTGRDDLTALEALMTEDLPVILLDHQPVTGESAESGKIQLQLSGHTHDGQIFPFHIFDAITRSLSYGLYRRGSEQIIVSSGVGEFAVPVRFGSPAEIVAIDISLKQLGKR